MAIKSVTVIRDKHGMWTHPDLPIWDEDVSEQEIKAWFKENDGDYAIDMFVDSAPIAMIDSWFENGDCDCSEWQPTSDAPGAFLMSIHDTEDGPIGLFFIPDTSDSAETIEYTCVDCGSTSDVPLKTHNDETLYWECACGERCAPSSSDEIRQINARNI